MVGNINMSWGGTTWKSENSPPKQKATWTFSEAFKTLLLDWIFVKKTVTVTGYNFFWEVSCEIVQ